VCLAEVEHLKCYSRGATLHAKSKRSLLHEKTLSKELCVKCLSWQLAEWRAGQKSDSHNMYELRSQTLFIKSGAALAIHHCSPKKISSFPLFKPPARLPQYRAAATLWALEPAKEAKKCFNTPCGALISSTSLLGEPRAQLLASCFW
jgi:hypothetical protein